MKNLVFIVATSAALFVSTGSEAKAQWEIDVSRFAPNPVFALDYQVWGLNPDPLWVWDIVVIGEDGPEVVSSGHATERDAQYRLFRMVDWGLIHWSAEVDIVRRNDRQFQLLAVYDTRAEADYLADILRMIGWRSEVVPVWAIDWP